MKDDLVYIEHINQAIEKIFQYSKGLTKESFKTNEMVQDAVIRNIEIIGEATKKISRDFRTTYYEIPWKEMAGIRDKLIHDYMGIDVDVIWKTIEIDLTELKLLFQKIDT